MTKDKSGRDRRAIWVAGLAITGIVVAVAAVSAVSSSGPPAASVSRSTFHGHGSIDEAYVLGAPPRARLTLLNGAGARVGSGLVDKLGSLIIRNLTPGSGFRFEQKSGTTTRATAPFTVLSTTSPPPAPSFYSSQHLHAGLNYVRMRDGVLIAATVRLPPGKTLADGPFPTVIEYSGYGTAAPHSLINAEEGSAPTNDPLLPDSSTVVGALIAPLLGFVTVSVQMRGTGCSGGAFDLLGYPSDYDGYDIVQAVGSQSWALHHKVGLVGISYSGLSQFAVAGTDPPDLAAITPLSPTDDLFSTGYPGGIYNDGFAKSWIQQRIVDAQAAPQSGQPWAAAEIATGDKTCLANQRLHPEAESLASLVGPGLARTPSLFDRRSPAVWATHVKVPVFLVGSLEDEQVGPQWPALITALKADKNVFVTMLNGTHTDSLGPDTVSRWLEFLDIYVAGQVPRPSSTLAPLAAALYTSLTGGAPAAPVPALRFTTEPSVSAAKKAYAAGDPRVRVLFDNGGGSLGPGALQPAFTAGFSSWPPSGNVTRFALGSGGTLSRARPLASSTAAFRPDPSVRPADDLPTGNAWAAQPPYDWTPVPTANGLGFETPVLTKDLTIVGPASLDLMLKSTAKVTDLQVTVTEVRPVQSEEQYVTSGFLRSSNRTLTSASTALDPVPTYLRSDKSNLPAGRFTLVRIPVDPIAHTFRAGTRLRIVISAPGGDRPSWTFQTPATHGSVTDTIALGGSAGSSFVVNEVAGVTPTSALPACGALRGEPCRADTPLANQI
ncbi:MAG TPA: CocE/NonD family hydrolase [Acidimicrobiales bacterium]|nr:CocE/NonD family hydrolase [Acidimicrobiales bacterium]